MSSEKSYAQETADRLRKEGNFKDADVDVNDVIQIIEDDEEYIQSLNKKIAAKDAEIKELRKCLKEAVRLHCDNLDGDCLHCIRCGVCNYLKWRMALEGGHE